jgi:NAD(P)-dependent dehydrogenase (short-subunit alcohol dehydrogenase family)
MFREDLLRDKRILITGGGTGLGKAMAHRFLEARRHPLHLRPPRRSPRKNRRRTFRRTKGTIHASPATSAISTPSKP